MQARNCETLAPRDGMTRLDRWSQWAANFCPPEQFVAEGGCPTTQRSERHDCSLSCSSSGGSFGEFTSRGNSRLLGCGRIVLPNSRGKDGGAKRIAEVVSLDKVLLFASSLSINGDGNRPIIIVLDV